MRVRHMFEVVEIKETFRWREKGKRRQKTETFSQTINQFNKDSKGRPKTRVKIERELKQQRDTWLSNMREEHPDWF